MPTAPPAFSTYADLVREAEAVSVMLDFDGTLAPIQPDPETVSLPPESQEALDNLVCETDVHVAIISGRSLDDLRSRIAIDGIDIAGNHGLEIEQDDGRWIHPVVEETRPRLEHIASDLRDQLAEIPGSWVEDKHASLTIHFRQVPSARVSDVITTVLAATSGEPAVDTRRGKDSVEIRPRVDWDKGAALALFADPSEDSVTIFAGDDTTDIDGFERLTTLSGETISIGVGDRELPTDIHLADPSEVGTLLQAISTWRLAN